MKEMYEMPQIEVLDLELEGLIAQSSLFGFEEPKLPAMDLLNING